LQQNQKYSKPVFITVASTVLLMIVCIFSLFLPRLRQYRSLWTRSDVPKVAGFASLDFAANLSFMFALSLTNAPSALSLEQVTSVYIGFASWILFSEQFPPLKILGFLISVGGNAIVTWADGSGDSKDARDQLLGDAIVVVAVAISAAAYMVLLKRLYPHFSIPDLFHFFRVKALFVLLLAVPTLVISHYTGFEIFEWPQTSTAWTLLILSHVCGIGFNVSLAWCILEYSPLSARLSILLGLPIAFCLNLVLGGSFSLTTLTGIIVVVFGLAIFEVSERRMRGDPLHKPLVTQVSDACDHPKHAAV
jgi:solute carrier family 35 protein F5